MSASLSRRLLLGGSAGVMLAGGGVRADPTGHAITVGCWGGAFASTLQSAVDEPLSRNAAIAVRQVVSDEQARVARVAAGGATPGAGDRLDVALLSDVDAYRLSLRQLFTPVTTAGVSTLPHILPGLRIPYGVPQARTALCVAFNAKRLSYPPRGFAALFEAARKGRVGFSSELAIHNLAAAAIALRNTAASLQTAKATFTALKRAGTLRIYPTNEALGEALASGEIEMAPMWRSRAYSWQEAGRDIRDVIPDEGAIPFTILACAPGTGPGPGPGVAGAAGRTGPAMLYLDALLHADAQRAMAQRLGLLPTVDTVRLDEKLLTRIGFTAGQRARFRPLSLASVAQNGVALRHFWDQELA